MMNFKDNNDINERYEYSKGSAGFAGTNDR